MRDVPTREQLLHLLAEAAELEHNLLCSYLFALFSLKDDEAPDLLVDERASVQRWKKALLGVCVEEMLHFAQVANLTAAIGAHPHLNRPNLPVAAGYHPAAVVVELTKFDLDTLQHFIHLERPEGLDVPDGDSFAPDLSYRRESHPGALMPAAPDYQTIGEFYGELRDKMAAFCAARGERALFVGSKELQMRPEEVRSQSLHVVVDLATATSAIDEIVRQGEGAPGEAAESHFAQFMAIQQEYSAHLAARPDFAPSHAVGRNPVMRFPVADGRTHVTHPAAFQLLDAGNAIYGFMLRCLGACYQTPWQEAAAREGVLRAAFQSMRALSIVGSELARLPASQADDAGPRAGLSFAMMRSAEGLEAASATQVLRERASELSAHVGELPLGASARDKLRLALDAVSKAIGAPPAEAPASG
ncbi:MAG: ferritin-like domain-containing protein [Vitreoscilla sp.]